MSGFDFELFFLFRKAVDKRETDPDEAIRMLDEIRDLAIERGNDEWKLRAEHWRIQTYITSKKDFNKARQLVAEAAVAAREPHFQNYQEYTCLQNDLMLVYDGIDPVGYAPDIKEAIDLTISKTTPAVACHFCLNRDLIAYHLGVSDEAAARDQTAKFFDMTIHEDHYHIQAYERLCYFARKDEAWRDLEALARAGADLANTDDQINHWIILRSYHTLALYHLDRVEEAERVHDTVEYRVSTLKMVQGHAYYTLKSAYQEAQGKLEDALNTVDAYLKTLDGTGRIYWECKIRLERIRLVKKLGYDTEADVTLFKERTQKLKAKTQFDTQLAELLSH
ncbi:MAG: hypothetical protein AAFV98_22860 [Chloroflexota bacterium]